MGMAFTYPITANGQKMGAHEASKAASAMKLVHNVQKAARVLAHSTSRLGHAASGTHSQRSTIRLRAARRKHGKSNSDGSIQFLASVQLIKLICSRSTVQGY